MKDMQWLMQTVFCHRGLHNNKDVPENSRAAFLRAAEQGFGSELDVYLTKDGRLIVHHDATLKRMCGMNLSPYRITGKLEDYPLLGTKECIPLFSDVLKDLGDKGKLIVEIKTTSRVEATCKAVYDALKDFPGKWCIESFNWAITDWWVKHHPEVIIGQLYDTYSFQFYPVKLRKQYKKMDFLAIPVRKPREDYFKKIKAEHPEKLIVMWTIRTADNYKTALDTADNIIFECNDKNADYISTDKARSFLADKTE